MNPMKRLAVLLPLLILLTSGLVIAATPQEAMMQSLKTGNYSVVKPYLSPLMRTVLSRNLLITVRDGLVKKYGEIKGYTLIRSETKDGSTTYYYRVIAERGNYTVSVTVRGGRIVGFHTKEIPFSITWRIVYPLAGSLLGLVILWAYLRRFHGAELILGAVLLIPVLIFQPMVQSIPRFIGLQNLGFLIVWMGLVAALFQEPLKYYFSRGKGLRKALYVGAGFGIGESVYVALISLFLGGASWLTLVERFLALMFHASTTTLFAYAYTRGWGRKALLSMIMVHWLIDSLATYWRFNPSVTILGACYGIMLVVSMIILVKLLPEAKAERNTKAVMW